ncbi:zinc finger matrin-type protein 3-like [Glandiceps talaboti]
MTRMPGYKAGTSVIAGIKRKADSDEPVVEIPQELMEPLNCKLCDIMLNSPPQAQAHYQGKNHQKKIRQYIAQRSLSAKMPTLSQPPTTTQASETTDTNAGGTESNSYEYCQLCNISFTSVVHAKSHYEGKNHAKRLRNQAPVYSKNAYYCCLCNLSLNSESQYDQHISSKKHATALKKKEFGTDIPTPEEADSQNGQNTLIVDASKDQEEKVVSLDSVVSPTE